VFRSFRCQRGRPWTAPGLLSRGDLAQAKRHIVRTTGDPAGPQRPQADPSGVTDQQGLAKVKRDAVLHAGQ